MKQSKFRPAKEFTALLTPAERAASKAMAKSIIAEQRTLAEIRKTGALTQSKLGTKLKIGQDQVSRLEKRADMLLSTLKKYVSAVGGSVHIVVEIPGKPPVRLGGFGEVPVTAKAARKPRAKAA